MSIVTIQSQTPSQSTRSFSLHHAGFWYIFDTVASKRQFIRRLRRGYDFHAIIKWATGMGPDPLEIEVEESHVYPQPQSQEIEVEEYESQSLGYSLVDYKGGYARPLEDITRWVWQTLIAFKQAGWKKPKFTFPRYYKGEWNRFLNIYWELLDYLPVDIDPLVALDYSYLRDIGWSVETISRFHAWKEIWEVRGCTADHEWLSKNMTVFSTVVLGNPTTREFLLYTWEEWAIPLVEDDEEELNLDELVFNLDSIFESEETFIKESFETLYQLVYHTSRLAPQKDTCQSIRPRFYTYKTDVLELASSSKKKSLRKEQGLMIGIELEFSHSSYSLKELYSLTHMGVFKYDSSVDGEYVTLPYTPSEMISRITEFGSVFNKLLSTNGWEGNGMHIHVSRKALTSQQMLNLQVLLNPSSSEGQEYWSKVADRRLQDNRYCGFILPQYLDPQCLYTDTRYVVLNFTNKHTVEFRMFKSPTNYSKVLWNLQVVLGLLEFSKSSNSLEEWIKSPLNPMNN